MKCVMWQRHDSMKLRVEVIQSLGSSFNLVQRMIRAVKLRNQSSILLISLVARVSARRRLMDCAFVRVATLTGVCLLCPTSSISSLRATVRPSLTTVIVRWLASCRPRLAAIQRLQSSVLWLRLSATIKRPSIRFTLVRRRSMWRQRSTSTRLASSTPPTRAKSLSAQTVWLQSSETSWSRWKIHYVYSQFLHQKPQLKKLKVQQPTKMMLSCKRVPMKPHRFLSVRSLRSLNRLRRSATKPCVIRSSSWLTKLQRRIKSSRQKRCSYKN